jgi:hypothetical protein
MHPFIASCVASLVARLVVHPLDSIKTLLQSKSKLRGLKTRLRLKGFFSLYDGLPVTLLFALPGMAVYLYLYDWTTAYLLQSLDWPVGSFGSAIVGACVAELVSGLIWTPMEVVKSRQQVYLPSSLVVHHADSLDADVDAADANTNQLVTSGHEALLDDSLNTNHPILNEDAIEQEDTLLDNNNNEEQALLGTPISTISSNSNNQSTWRYLVDIYREEGLLGFQRGYFVTLLVFLPYSVLYFVVYEQVTFDLHDR